MTHCVSSEHVAARAQPLDERNERNFRGVGLAVEHRLAEERAAKRDTVEPAHQPIAVPRLDRVRKALLVKRRVALDDLARRSRCRRPPDPGPLPHRRGSRRQTPYRSRCEIVPAARREPAVAECAPRRAAARRADPANTTESRRRSPSETSRWHTPRSGAAGRSRQAEPGTITSRRSLRSQCGHRIDASGAAGRDQAAGDGGGQKEERERR